MPVRSTMLAAVLYGKEDVRIEELPIPAIGPREVRIRIQSALTCGTDVKVYRRGYHARMIQPPAVFGHEFAGIIDAVGEEVTQWWPAMRVSAANSAPCGSCSKCSAGQWEFCDDLLFLNGAYAEYITVPQRIVERNLYELPDSLSFEHAALAEPLACVLHGMQALNIEGGSSVAVLGLGPIGLFFVRVCVLAGANVIAAGRRSERLKAARTLGAQTIINIDEVEDVASAIRNHSGGPSVVIEAVGSPKAWEQAVDAVGKRGTVCLFGGCPAGTKASLDTHRIHYDELTLLGRFHHTPRSFQYALKMLATGEMMPETWIQRYGSLSELPVIMANLAGGKDNAVKIAIDTGSSSETGRVV